MTEIGVMDDAEGLGLSCWKLPVAAELRGQWEEQALGWAGGGPKIPFWTC